MNKLYEIIEKNRDEMLNTLDKLISIPSVSGAADCCKPYGEECARVLDEMLKTADNMGFVTTNFENYVGTIRFDERSEKLGILCHLDVVPTIESEWTYPPFKATLSDGRIYGRGAIDNKGPAVAVLYAMKAIKQAEIKLNENVRFIVGCNEENGSSDIDYYLTRQKMPPLVFTPDGSYPVINAEKGMIRLTFSKKLYNSDILEFNAGSVINAVPSEAYVVLKNISVDDVPENEKTEVSVTPYGLKIKFNGRAGHASTPHLADNALTGLIDFIKKLPVSEGDISFLTAVSAFYPYNEYDGKSLDINACDESGKLTNVMTVAKLCDNVITFSTDIRFPVSVTNSDIIGKLTPKLESMGCNVNVIFKNDFHYVNPESEFIKKLLSVYEYHTGDISGCKTIGGGTYVHNIEGGVAFGAEFPNEENNMHSADESISVESLLKNTRIFADAIIKICGQNS